MKCSKCKSHLKKGEKFCPMCGAKVTHTARNISLIVLVVAILICGAGIVGWQFGLLSTKEASLEENITLLSGRFTDRLIVDQTSALAAIGDVADILGIDDVEGTLVECREDTVFGNTYYRFYQEYEGIPVYGRSVVVIADADGNSLSLSGNYAAVHDVMKPAGISQEDVERAVKDYFSEQYAVSEFDGLIVEQISDDMLCIYNMDDDCILGYQLYVECPQVGCYQVIVDAEGEKVVYAHTLLRNDYQYQNGEMESIKASGQKAQQALDVYSQNGMYYMADPDRGIEVYQAESELSGFLFWKTKKNTGEFKEVHWSRGGQPSGYAEEVDALANIQITYDYFQQELDHRSSDGDGGAGVYVYTRIIKLGKKDWTDNAASGIDLEKKQLSYVLDRRTKTPMSYPLIWM